jgi:hypothetical protein
MNFIKCFLVTALLCLGYVPVWGETMAGETPSESPERVEVPHSHLEGLHNFDEAALFLLQRYATLEGLVGALRAGRMENQAFAIGTASVIPGAGQMINGDYRQGGLLLLADSVAGINANQLAFSMRKARHQEWGLGYYSASILQNGVMLYATLHAANASYRTHQDSSRAMWTGVASVVPGAGQAINGNWWEAAGFFAAYSVATVWATDMENHFYGTLDKNSAEASGQNTTWSVSVLPMGLAVKAEW